MSLESESLVDLEPAVEVFGYELDDLLSTEGLVGHWRSPSRYSSSAALIRERARCSKTR